MTSAPAIPLLIEKCAGTASLSVRLERAGANPLVPRIGSKRGYADVILALAGLSPGARAGRYLWCEPDPGVRQMLNLYRDPHAARTAQDTIRAWHGEPQRALYDRLRAEGDPEYDMSPREAARWLLLALWSYRRGVPESGFDPAVPTGKPTTMTANGAGPRTCDMEAARLDNLPHLIAEIQPDARHVAPPRQVEAGTLVYIDPPYVDTTKYGHDLPRHEVVNMARAWAAAGARVMISEAEPIEPLTADGWTAVEITAMRSGQTRTFSVQQREWVTCSFDPDPRIARACRRAVEREKRRAAQSQPEQAALFGAPA